MLQTEEKPNNEIVETAGAASTEGAVSAEAPVITEELAEMFKAGVHFGYSRSRRHPKMEPYLFGIRNNIEVFDLEKVKVKLDEALAFLRKMGEEKKMVVFVGTKPSVRDMVEKTARELEMPYVKERWLGGLLTNFTALRKRMDYFEGLKQAQKSGELEKYTKKEQLEIEREIAKLDRNLGGVVKLKKLPDAIVVVDPKDEKIAVREAQARGVPVVAILSSDNDPEGIDFLVPANDSSNASVAYLLSRISGAYKEGLSIGALKTEDKAKK
ncbi:MAG: 30S ribosomal protein S2 [Candidatus Niyogibacteria bacterium]|nr:30S ribosomal protein S2 [Candidatus Niyogibacteria bacterium]